mmetsp:Transcript_10550/g.13776  ORF Transcript_10550/g.13776 Transcript_10550/m.13776 type:complete len:183 (-) Transcript_10550:215-763(-)
MNANQPIARKSSAANNCIGSMNGPTGTSSSSSSSPSSAIRNSSTTASQQIYFTEEKGVGELSPKNNQVDFTASATNRSGTTASLPTVERKQQKCSNSSTRKSRRQNDCPSQNKIPRERQVVLFYITRILKKKGGTNDDKDNSIKKAAFRLETILYHNSKSKEEYLDKTTLKSRIRNVLQSIK